MQSFFKIIIKSILTCTCIISVTNNTVALGERFQGSWREASGKIGIAQCISGSKTCIESGERIIEGIKISKPCWKYGYTTTCQFPSKNDCHLLKGCYEVSLRECLLYDSLGNCVNQRKEFSCKKREISFDETKRLRQKLTGDEAKRLICKGIPCIDGNCIDKSYAMDGDMMSSAAYLNAAAKLKSSNLFQGFSQHCTKKPVEYINCCKKKGWGEALGATCNQNERSLQDLRAKNLCVYVGKSTNGIAPLHTNKHHFCCFGNMLNKVLQTQARKQLRIGFGHGGFPDCRGLTIEEIQKLDFEKMDFSEFMAEIKERMKIPNVADIETRMKDSVPKIKRVKEDDPHPELNPENKKAGMNEGVLKQLGDDHED